MLIAKKRILCINISSVTLITWTRVDVFNPTRSWGGGAFKAPLPCTIFCPHAFKGECSIFLKKIIFWMKTIHYLNTIRSHLVTIAPMAPFTPKSTSNLRSALHIRYSKVIPRFISRANTAQT